MMKSPLHFGGGNNIFGCNAYRFSIEWARIEQEIKHYREVLEFCHEKNVTPIVTLHTSLHLFG